MDTENETAEVGSETVKQPTSLTAGFVVDKKRLRVIAVVVAVVLVAALIVRYSSSDSSTTNGQGSTSNSSASKPTGNLKVDVDKSVELINSQNYGAAIELLKSVIARDSKIAVAPYNLGVAYQFSGQLAEAEAAYTQSLTLDNANPNSYYNRGLARRDLGNLEGAAADLRVAAALAPKWAGAKYNLGQVLMSLGLKEEANKVIAEAQKLEKSSGK